MEQTALYRKYRSKTFDEIVGQNHIVKSLTNQIKNGTIGHAYLFCGSRGTGKTSIAKIFARAINCETPKNGSPCGKCKTCKALSTSSNMDIIEIDAASNNKVDEIRDLRDKVKYPPIEAKYKVYIIDEVHMLTDSAFNALLKTLEEPPQHVVFILATTDVQKLPATILSRLMRFDFKLINKLDLINHLKFVFNDSKILYEDEAIDLIASLGEGSVRDALSIADMCIAYGNGNVTYQSVVEAVGTVDKKTLFEIAKLILEKDGTNILSKIDEICNKGKSILQITKDLLSYFRDLAVIKTCSDYSKILVYTEDLLDKMVTVAKNNDIHNIINILSKLGTLESDYKNTLNQKAVFEIAILNLMYENNKDLENRINILEKDFKKLVSP